MFHSEQVELIATALTKAQAEMDPAALDKENPHFKSRYASLTSLRAATIPALSKNGLAILQGTSFADGALILTTMLVHTSGQWFKSLYPLPFMPDKPQAMGSARTYARRYEWSSILGMASEEDDDANAAQAAAANKKSKTQKDAPTADMAPEESAAQTAHLLAKLEECKTRTAVDDFAKEHVAIYGRLIPEHQQTVRDATMDKRSALADAASQHNGG